MKLIPPYPEGFRPPPELRTLERVIAVGEMQTHGFVTFALASIELFDDGWRARVRQRIDPEHPLVRALDEETLLERERIRALGRPPTMDDLHRPRMRPLPQAAAEAHDGMGTSYWTHGPSGGTSSSAGQAWIGDLDFAFGPAVPSDARRLVFRSCTCRG